MTRLLPPRLLPVFLMLSLLPGALAHGLAGDLVPLGSPLPATAAPVTPLATGPATDPVLVLDDPFGPEAGVLLAAPANPDERYWRSEPTTDYDLRFICPEITDTVGADPPAGQEPPSTCPAYVLDPEDVMAQPDLVVDPRDDSLVAFHALHGGPGVRLPTQDPLPTPHSRDNVVHQPHTAFQSKDGGAFWEDNRYYSRLEGMAEVFGEDNALALDPRGAVTLASLYSYREEAGQQPGFAVFLLQSERIHTTIDYDKGYVWRFPTAAADSLDLAWHPGAGEMAVLWRTAGPEGPRVWLEHKADQWTAWNQTEEVGPCDALSNAVAIGDDLLFACAQGSDTRVWAVRSDWSVRDLGLAPVHGMTSLRLASAESLRDGGLVLAGAGAREGRTHTVLVWGVDGTHWGRPSDYGDALTDVVNRQGASLVDAHVTALAVLATSGTAHFLVQEEYLGGTASDDRVFAKVYAVAQATGRFLGTFGIGYGDPQSRATVPATVAGIGPGAFHDAHDSLVVIQGDRGEDRLIVAFGDYGYVRYGEVVELNQPPPLFPPITATAAIPTLSVATSPVLVGALAGALSLSAAGRIALAKSKKAAEVQA